MGRVFALRFRGAVRWISLGHAKKKAGVARCFLVCGCGVHVAVSVFRFLCDFPISFFQCSGTSVLSLGSWVPVSRCEVFMGFSFSFSVRGAPVLPQFLRAVHGFQFLEAEVVPSPHRQSCRFRIRFIPEARCSHGWQIEPVMFLHLTEALPRAV